MAIIKPDLDRAKELLDKLAAEMTKHEMCLIHKPDCMVLAVFDPAKASGHEWRAVAQVELIYPDKVLWRPIRPKTGLLVRPM